MSRLLARCVLPAALVLGCSSAGVVSESTEPPAPPSASAPLPGLTPVTPGQAPTAPVGSAVASTTPSHAASPSRTAGGLGPMPSFPVGALLVTTEDHVRMRSKPSTADDSRKYEPLLPLGTSLHALEGPVAGSGYWWYRVELTEDQTLYDGVDLGWIAAGDHDGSPWLDWYRDVDPGPTWPPVTSDWPTVRLGDVRLSGDSVGLGSFGALEVPIVVRGYLPGSTLYVTVVGDYDITWVCGGGPEGEFGSGVTDGGRSRGRYDSDMDIRVGGDGMGRATVILRAEQPDQACPADYPGPRVDWSGRWSHVQVTAPAPGLRLTPPAYDWQDAI